MNRPESGKPGQSRAGRVFRGLAILVVLSLSVVGVGSLLRVGHEDAANPLRTILGEIQQWWNRDAVRVVQLQHALRATQAELQSLKAEFDRMSAENESLRRESEELREKLARVSELILYRRRAMAARYRPRQLQIRVGGCGGGLPECPPDFWPLLSKLIGEAQEASDDLLRVQGRFLADFGIEELARVYASDDSVACSIWARREDAIATIRGGAKGSKGLGPARIAEEATDEFLAKWGAPEVYVVGSKDTPALCKISLDERIDLYRGVLTKQ